MSVFSAEQTARGGRVFLDLADERRRIARSPAQPAERYATLVRAGLLHLPRPGHGDTGIRFAILSELGAADLCLARLAEGHADAVAILEEAGHAVPAGRLGVWAADPPDGRVGAERDGQGRWVLKGTKRWCSGASVVDAALVTAHAADGYRLFIIDLRARGVSVHTGDWRAVGMRASDTGAVHLDRVVVDAVGAVGGPGWYLERAGFWPGGAGVAAAWYGGIMGLTELLQVKLAGADDPHGFAELGTATALGDAMRAQLGDVARVIDEAGHGAATALAVRRAVWSVRTTVERLALAALAHLERGLGAGVLTADPRAAALAADLPIYVRQHHGGRDAEALGRLVVE